MSIKTDEIWSIYQTIGVLMTLEKTSKDSLGKGENVTSPYSVMLSTIQKQIHSS